MFLFHLSSFSIYIFSNVHLRISLLKKLHLCPDELPLEHFPYEHFHSVVIRTALPIGEYAAVALLLFFGLKSIKDAWDLPAKVVQSGDKSSPELGEFVEAEELVKEKVIILFQSLPLMGF